MNTITPSPEDAIEVLLQRQRESGELVIDYPISLLQRQFRLSYAPTVALMNELERQGFLRRISETAVELMLSPEQSSLEKQPSTYARA
jgi:DNA segregation ATPase FtsK/SpoIIIE-like protein